MDKLRTKSFLSSFFKFGKLSPGIKRIVEKHDVCLPLPWSLIPTLFSLIFKTSAFTSGIPLG